jgi:hypothetical protein
MLINQCGFTSLPVRSKRVEIQNSTRPNSFPQLSWFLLTLFISSVKETLIK